MEERQFIMAYVVIHNNNNDIEGGIIVRNAIDSFQALGIAYRDLVTEFPTDRIYINSNMCSIPLSTVIRSEVK